MSDKRCDISLVNENDSLTECVESVIMFISFIVLSHCLQSMPCVFCVLIFLCHTLHAHATHVTEKKAAIQLRHFDDMFYIIIDTHQNIA